MKTIVKENNGGGLSIELYNDNDEIESIFAGLEFGQHGIGVNDVKQYGVNWDWSDAGGNSTGYHAEGNTSGDCGEDGEELTASDVVDDSEWTNIIAEWDGSKMVLYVENMGGNGRDYFGIDE